MELGTRLQFTYHGQQRRYFRQRFEGVVDIDPSYDARPIIRWAHGAFLIDSTIARDIHLV